MCNDIFTVHKSKISGMQLKHKKMIKFDNKWEEEYLVLINLHKKNILSMQKSSRRKLY